MGMFDSVRVECAKCGELVEFQSKAGECVLADWRVDAVPTSIAIDLNGAVEHCKCGQRVELRSGILQMSTMIAFQER